MGIFMRVILLMVREMEKENIMKLQVIFMKAIGRMV
jgi:hypothetical protein